MNLGTGKCSGKKYLKEYLQESQEKSLKEPGKNLWTNPWMSLERNPKRNPGGYHWRNLKKNTSRYPIKNTPREINSVISGWIFEGILWKSQEIFVKKFHEKSTQTIPNRFFGRIPGEIPGRNSWKDSRGILDFFLWRSSWKSPQKNTPNFKVSQKESRVQYRNEFQDKSWDEYLQGSQEELYGETR